jgi:hypothetical protein
MKFSFQGIKFGKFPAFSNSFSGHSIGTSGSPRILVEALEYECSA